MKLFSPLSRLLLAATLVGAALPAAALAQGQQEFVVNTFSSIENRKQVQNNGVPAIMRVNIDEPGSAPLVLISTDVTTGMPQSIVVNVTPPEGPTILITVQQADTTNGYQLNFVPIPEFAGIPVRGRWMIEVTSERADALVPEFLNSFSVTLVRPGVNGVPFVNLIDSFTNTANDSFNAFAAGGDTLRALASLFYYYAFVSFYQGELDQSPPNREFGYYFFLAHYFLNREYAEGNPDEARRLYYEQLAYAYFQFYSLHGFPEEAQSQYAFYLGLAVEQP